MKCRVCRIVEGTVYYDGDNKPTKTPACQACYETLVTRKLKDAKHAPGYVGPGRDPDHQKLNSEQLQARDWWDSQIGPNKDDVEDEDV